MQLDAYDGISPSERIKALRMLGEYHEDWMTARDVEAAVHAFSTTARSYMDKIQQLVHNMHTNPVLSGVGVSVAMMSDRDMASGTILEEIEREGESQRLRFEQIIQEKYEMVNRASYKATMRCRRCGSSDVTCEQKQTRGADEAMTIFCTCSKCQNRWTMR